MKTRMDMINEFLAGGQRVPAWLRRLDKGRGGYARTRRWEKALERKGLEDRSVAVGSFTCPEGRSKLGKGSLTIYRDVIRRMRRKRRPVAVFRARDID